MMNDERRSDVERYWDRHVAASNLPGDRPLTTESWPEEIAFYMTPEQEFAYRALGRLRSRRVIEIGCGVGVNAINLAHRGAWVVAIDPSQQRLEVLRKVATEMHLSALLHPVRASAEHLPFRSDSFDAAYTKATLIHTDLPEALSECRRVLRPSGRGIFCEPTAYNPFARFYRRFFGPSEWRALARYFSRAEERVVAETFGNLRAESFYLSAFLAFYWQFGRRRLKRFKRWLGALHSLDRALFAVCPPLRRLAWFRVYVVEKRPEHLGGDLGKCATNETSRPAN